jgi:hypothetical protein
MLGSPHGMGSAMAITDTPRAKNRRVALILVGWIAAMAVVSILVIALR